MSNWDPIKPGIPDPAWNDEQPGPGPGGTDNYNSLKNKPSINGAQLIGDKLPDELGIASEEQINILYQAMLDALNTKQDLMEAGDGVSISPSNVISLLLKTINNQSLIGSGNIEIGGGGGSGNADFDIIPENNLATTSANGEHLIFDFSEEDTLEARASIPGSWEGRKVLATKGYVDSHPGGVFVLDISNPCSYNELQSAINAPKVVLIKHSGNTYPFVEKWETDEGNKRFVNIASLQRQGADKGAMYFFFEATIGDFDSPMVYSSDYVQPTGKPYTDSITGSLSNLATTDKENLVASVNEVNGKVGTHIEVDAERWYGTYTDENGVTYQVYTKTIYIPALAAAAGATTYPHGITNIKQILSAYGFTTDGFVMNAPRQNVADNISIYQVQKTGGIVIEVGKDRSSKKAYVTLIYAKNN